MGAHEDVHTNTLIDRQLMSHDTTLWNFIQLFVTLREGRERKQPRARINEASCALEEPQKSSAHLGNTSSIQGIADLTMLHIAMFSTACLILVGYIKVASAGSVVLNSNSIKVGLGVSSPGLPVSPSPDESPADSGSLNFAIDTPQVRI